MWELLPGSLVRDEIRWGVRARCCSRRPQGARRATEDAENNNPERQYRADQRHGQVGRILTGGPSLYG